jgi:hypothetical protein
MAKKKAPPHAWKAGQSGNPSGLPKHVREVRQNVKEALDKAFTEPDGSDGLVKAIVAGTREGDGVCIKLACEYRWGKPVQPVTFDPGKMADDELRNAVRNIVHEWDSDIGEGAVQ